MNGIEIPNADMLSWLNFPTFVKLYSSTANWPISLKEFLISVDVIVIFPFRGASTILYPNTSTKIVKTDTMIFVIKPFAIIIPLFSYPEVISSGSLFVS